MRKAWIHKAEDTQLDIDAIRLDRDAETLARMWTGDHPARLEDIATWLPTVGTWGDLERIYLAGEIHKLLKAGRP